MANKKAAESPECIYCEEKCFKSQADWRYHFLWPSHNEKAAASIQQWPNNARKSSIVISGIEQIDPSMLLEYVSYSVDSLNNMVFFEPKATICLVVISNPAEFKRFLDDSHTIGQNRLRLKAYCDLRLIEWDAYFEKADKIVRSPSQSENSIRREIVLLQRTEDESTNRYQNNNMSQKHTLETAIGSESRLRRDYKFERRYGSNETSSKAHRSPESDQSGNTENSRYKQRYKDPYEHGSGEISRSQSRYNADVALLESHRREVNETSHSKHTAKETSKFESVRGRSRETSYSRQMEQNDIHTELSNKEYGPRRPPEAFFESIYSKNSVSKFSLQRQSLDEDPNLGTVSHKSVHESSKSQWEEPYRNTQKEHEVVHPRLPSKDNRGPEPYRNTESDLLYSRRPNQDDRGTGSVSYESLRREYPQQYISPWENIQPSATGFLPNTERYIEDSRDPEPHRHAERELPFTRRQNKDINTSDSYRNDSSERDLPYTRRPNKDAHDSVSNKSFDKEQSRREQREPVPASESYKNIGNQSSLLRRQFEDIQGHLSHKRTRNDIPDSRSQIENVSDHPSNKRGNNDNNATSYSRSRPNSEDIPRSNSYQNDRDEGFSSGRQFENDTNPYSYKHLNSETPLADWELDHIEAANSHEPTETARFKRQRFDVPVPESYNIASYNALYSRRNFDNSSNPTHHNDECDEEIAPLEQTFDDSSDSQQDSESEYKTHHHQPKFEDSPKYSPSVETKRTINENPFIKTNHSSSSNIHGASRSMSSSSKPFSVDTTIESQTITGWKDEMDTLYKKVVMPGAAWTARKRVTQDLKAIVGNIFPKCEIVPCGPDFLGFKDPFGNDLFVVYLDYNGLTNAENVGQASVIQETDELINRIQSLVVYELEHAQQVTTVSLYGKSAIMLKHPGTGISCKILLKPFKAAQTARLCKQLYLMDKRAIILIIMVTYWAKEQEDVSALGLRNPYVLYWLVFFYLMDKKILPSVIELQESCNYEITDGMMNVAFAYDENQFVDVGSLLASRTKNVRDDIKLLLDWFSYIDETFGSTHGKGINRRHSLICPRYGQLIDKRVFTVCKEMYKRHKKYSGNQKIARNHWTNNLVDMGFKKECWIKLKDLKLPDTLSIQHPLYISENIALSFNGPISQRIFHAIRLTREKLSWILLGTTTNVSLLNALSQKI